MVVDQHLRMRFCSVGVSALLGFPIRKLATMKLDQLLPPPYNTMHAKWIKVRCRHSGIGVCAHACTPAAATMPLEPMTAGPTNELILP